MFSCGRCGYATSNRTHFQRHLYRATVCSPKIADVSIDELRDTFVRNDVEKDYQFACHFCNNTFQSRTGRTLHIKNKHKEAMSPAVGCSANQNFI